MFLTKAALLGARVLRKAARLLESFGDAQTVAIRRSMGCHDMSVHPDELHYFEQYWAAIEPALEAHLPLHAGTVLDLGCGQGRMTVPVARWLRSGEVTGVDLTPSAIQAARTYASVAGVRGVTFVDGDALEFAAAVAANAVDAVLMLEVPFFMPRYRELIRRAGVILKPGGLLAVSFRPQYYNLLGAVRAGDWASSRLVRDVREGHWLGGSSWFSWHTPEDVRTLLVEAGFRVDSVLGIGQFSGIEGDPLSAIAQPSKLSPEARAQLLSLELSMAEEYPGNGRYILALATKPLEALKQ
ncbi:MAG: methyltransferase domain-containing protein [Acidobacteriota bacterium]